MKELPIADMRGVNFDQETGEYSRRRGDLCERCGQYDTCDKSTKNAPDEFVMAQCKEFLPIILFVNPKGTDDEFTTIRLGKAWMKRVVPGSKVALFDKNGFYGKARITWLHAGEKRATIFLGINTNHMMLDYDGKPDERHEKLTKIVRNSYGNLIYKNNDKATIIAMRRVA